MPNYKKPPYRIAIADDHMVVREGIASLLTKAGIFEVVFEAGNGHEFLEKMKTSKIDLAIVDLEMPVLDGTAICKRMHKEYPKVKKIVLSMYARNEHFDSLKKYSVDCYIEKSEGFAKLAEAAKCVLSGKPFAYVPVPTSPQYLSGKEVQKETHNSNNLTASEMKVLKLLAAGHSQSK